MSLYNFTVNYTSSVKYASIAAWAATHSYSLGAIVRRSTIQNSAANVFFCYQAGTSGGSEPTWSGNRGQSTTDSTVKWIEMGGQPAFNGDATNTNRWATVKNVGVDLGNIIKDASGNGFICTVNGTTGNGSEPTWNTALGATTTDNTVTWMSIGAISGYSNWANPHPLIGCATRSGWGGGGAGANPTLQQAYVAADHAGVPNGTAITSAGTVGAPIDVICVSASGSVPPVTADLATTGGETATSNNHGFSGYFRYVYGINLTVAGSSNNTINLNDSADDCLFKNCTFKLTTTGSSAALTISGAGKARCEDCTIAFGATGQSMHGAGRIELVGGTIGATGSVPTDLVTQSSTGQLYLFDGVDLSALTGTILVAGNSNGCCQYDFVDCKMPSSYTTGSIGSGGTTDSLTVNVVRCSASGDTDQLQTYAFGTTLSSDETVVRTGGASGVNPYSIKVVSGTNTSSGSGAFSLPPIVQPNPTTAADVTVTLFGIVNAAAVPTTFDAWLDVSYLGTSGNTHVSRVSSHPTDYLISTSIGNCTADSASAWDTKATARANSHSYSVGDVIKTSSNANRIFFCTSAGTSAASEPGGYATAIDGGSVTDSGATFRAGCRFKIAVVLTSPQPQIAGNFTAHVKVGKAATTYYFDPLLTLS
jgi:hypothetical protein